MKRIYLSPPHLGGLEEKYVWEAFKTNWVAPLGPQIDLFEKELAEYLQCKGAVALSSGTAALHLALRLAGVEQGDEVFCSSLTFVASANPVLYLGAVPVFIDSEPESWNMSPAALKRAFLHGEQIGKLPKAVIVVNLYGQSADMEPILNICSGYDVPVIEDAAESLGATYKEKASGTFGKFGIYSFNGNKIITTSGGGMLVSDDLEALEKARFWASQARDPAKHYQHSEVGYNYRMSNVLAGIGRGQLKVLNDRIQARRAVFRCYYESLSTINGIHFMPEIKNGFSTRWLTTLTFEPDICGVQAVQIVDALEESNIEARCVWKPMHRQPLFYGNRYYFHAPNDSVSDRLFQTGLCLPSGSNLTEKEQNTIIYIIKNIIADHNKAVL